MKMAVDKMTANLSVMFLTPLRHPIQQLVWLVNDQVGTLLITSHAINTQVTDRHLTKRREHSRHLGQNIQVGVCDETGHFNDLVFVNVQTRHLKNTDIKTSRICPFMKFKGHFRPVSTGNVMLW